MIDKRLTQNERDALVRLLKAAMDAKTVPPEDRALITRAKKKVEEMDVQRQARPPLKDPAKGGVRNQRWE